jgi:hypothetical protein
MINYELKCVQSKMADPGNCIPFGPSDRITPLFKIIRKEAKFWNLKEI